MENADAFWMPGILLLTFIVFFAVAMILRNYAAKRDTMKKTESGSPGCSLSKTPKNTTKN